MLIQASELTAKPGKGGVLRDTVAKMRDVLASASGAEWTAWLAFAGRPYGSYVLSTRHADYGAMLGGLLQLGASAEWAELAASADGVLAHPAPTVLAEVVAVTGEPTGPKQFTTITKSTLSGIETTGVDDTVCCYAEKTETWVHGPDGTRWEWYVKHADVDEIQNVVIGAQSCAGGSCCPS